MKQQEETKEGILLKKEIHDKLDEIWAIIKNNGLEPQQNGQIIIDALSIYIESLNEKTRRHQS